MPDAPRAELRPKDGTVSIKVLTIHAALKNLKRLNQEICYAACFEAEQFSSGLIAFRPIKKGGAKQVNHAHRDVVCQVIKGSGRLRTDKKLIRLRAGTICHIPKGTPHDFAADKSGELILFYSLIKS